jgi:hypothetical protein
MRVAGQVSTPVFPFAAGVERAISGRHAWPLRASSSSAASGPADPAA